MIDAASAFAAGSPAQRYSQLGLAFRRPLQTRAVPPLWLLGVPA